MTDQPPPYGPAPGQPGPSGQSVQSGQPGQPYPAYAPYPGGHLSPAPVGPASKGLAVTALVLAVLGVFVVSAVLAIVLATVVVIRSKDGRDRGTGMAVAALVVAPLWLLLVAGLAVLGLVSDIDRDPSGSVTEEGNVRVTSVKVGDCIKDAVAGRDYYALTATPCSQPHRLEAYAAFDLPGGDYPGDATVLQLAETGCSERYEPFVGRTYDQSTLEVQYLYPRRASWGSDTGVTCLVGNDSPTTGTLRGADR